MRKTFADMAIHIKSIILPEPPETFAMKPIFNLYLQPVECFNIAPP